MFDDVSDQIEDSGEVYEDLWETYTDSLRRLQVTARYLPDKESVKLAKTVEPVETSQNTGVKVFALGSIVALFAAAAALNKRRADKDSDFVA